MTMRLMGSGAQASRPMFVIMVQRMEGKAFATFRRAKSSSVLCRSFISLVAKVVVFQPQSAQLHMFGRPRVMAFVMCRRMRHIEMSWMAVQAYMGQYFLEFSMSFFL